ncbi:MAG: VOC family protein [Deltaproteobacteria bacterium]|nr:VOC family protein [Deltaproteobacteria bacterium]
MASTGQNVWFDLMTTDVEAAKRFYSDVIGWKTEQWTGGDPAMPYTMWSMGGRSLGGVMALPEDARKMGAPPHWIAYTVVDDVDATAAKAEKLGARVYAPPTDIPTVGRFAVLADPQGATFAIFKGAGPMDAPPDAVGQFSWAELNTTDYEAAWRFYSELFGWKHRSSMDMGPMGTYFMWNDPEGKTKGGMSNAAKAMNFPPHWLHYVTVDDVDATAKVVVEKGGKVMNGPMDIPGDDRIAQCQDPQGGFFAIYSHGKK